jgi:tetratricopeptide (TPR) repeat protein
VGAPRRPILALFLLAAGIATFANALDAPFVYDDRFAIEENASIRSLDAGALHAAPQLPTAGRPVVNVSLALNYALCGLSPRGYRAFNLGVHLACALLAWSLLRRIFQSPALPTYLHARAQALAWLAALLWMVHPLTSECVDYVTQRTESIMALFYLGTLLLADRAARSKRPLPWSIAAVLACCLGMASKESMVTAPLAVLLYDLAFFPSRARTKERRLLYAGLAATWMLLGALMASGPRSSSVGFDQGVGAVQYALNQLRVVARYLRLAVFPRPLIVDYGEPRALGFRDVVPSFALLLLLLAATAAAWWRRRPLGFAGVWFFLLLSPTSSFVPITTEVGADRRMYLPLLSCAALLVVFGEIALQRAERWAPSAAAACRKGAAIGALLLAMVLASATFRRNGDYQDPVKLWGSVVRADPENYRALNNLATALKSRGELDAALAHLRRASEVEPDSSEIAYNLGDVLRRAGRPEEAVAMLQRALELDPRSAQARNGLGLAYESAGDFERARAAFAQAIEDDPRFVEAYHNLARLLAREGDIGRGIELLSRALELRPGYAEGHNDLGVLLARAGRQEAQAHFRRAIEIRPDHAEAHANLGSALAERGELDQSLRHLGRALELRPSHFETLMNLGRVLVRAGRQGEAIASFEQAARLRPKAPEPPTEMARVLATSADAAFRDPARAVRLAEAAAGLVGSDPFVLDTLAAAYAASGRFDEATRTAQEALSRVQERGNARLEAEIQARIELYAGGRPYVEPRP